MLQKLSNETRAGWSFEEKTFVKQSMISEWEKVAQKVRFTHYAMLSGGG